MRVWLTIVAILLAFVFGFVAAGIWLRPPKKWAIDEFKKDVRQVRAAASVGSQVLEKLEAGDIDGAKLAAAPPIAGYYEVYRHFDDSSSYQQELVRRIETLIPRSRTLQSEVDKEKSSGRPDVAKTLLSATSASEKPH
jgi:hypothetical protein